MANNIKAEGAGQLIEIKGSSGTAGHILLTYPSGGKILTSMTHWAELVKVDTT